MNTVSNESLDARVSAVRKGFGECVSKTINYNREVSSW